MHTCMCVGVRRANSNLFITHFYAKVAHPFGLPDSYSIYIHSCTSCELGSFNSATDEFDWQPHSRSKQNKNRNENQNVKSPLCI